MCEVKPAGLSDQELCAASRRTTGEHDDVEAEALRAEIERRGLDV